MNIFSCFLFLSHYVLYFCVLKYIKQIGNSMNRIKEVLQEKGIKQIWLAEQLGKGFCIVNSYVCNRRQPSLEVLFVIAEILNVAPKKLIKEVEA